MSAIDRCNFDGCGHRRAEHPMPAANWVGQLHAFVEPPVPEPQPGADEALLCYQCGNGFADTCPLCGKSVCAACAEREGESCCDNEVDPLAAIASKWHAKGVAKQAHGPAMFGAVKDAYAAGRARGIEDERERCEGKDKP